MATPDTSALLSARLFASANPEVARRLGNLRLRAKNHAAGEIIFEPGEPADCIFLLAGQREASERAFEPLVQVQLSADGSSGRGDRAARLARIVRGDVFGETEFVGAGLDPKPGVRASTARALTPARTIAVAWKDLAELFELEPAIRARLVKLASRRLIDAVAAGHSASHEDPDIVLADWLVELAADLGEAQSNRVRFPAKLSQAEIAKELNVSRETVSRRLKEWERAGLVGSSAASLEIVDYARVVRIAGLHSGRDRAALARAVADVAAEIDRGDLINARNICADMLRYFPSSPELLHLFALAAARSGDREEAIAVLKAARLTADGDLEALRARAERALKNPFASAERLADEWVDEAFDEPDEEASPGEGRAVETLVGDLAALEARLLKDSAFESDAAGDAAIAAESQRAYEAIWRRIGSWYAGINASAMALVAGDAKSAKALAAQVLKRLPEDASSYWAAATRAEALLISGDGRDGLQALRHAAAASDASDSTKASTMLQLRRLAPRLRLDVGEAAADLGVRSVALVTGHLFRGSEMDAAAQATAGDAIRAEAEQILTARNVGNVFGALACGSDIVVAEAAVALGIPFHAVLPFPLERYAELSVAIGDTEGAPSWRKRFDDVLSHAASLTLIDDELPLDRDLDGHFFHAFRFMAGLAMMRADVLEAECRLLAVTDGSEASNLAGTSRAVADWLAAGRPLDPIAFPFSRKAPSGRARGASAFRPVVLLWDVAASGAGEKAVAKSGVAKKKDFSVVARSSRVGGEGIAVVAPSLQSAIRLAETCAAGKGGAQLRVICDFGPVLGADMKPDEKMIARLKAGSDMPGFPPGRPLATLTFAAQAVAEFGSCLQTRAVGRAEETADDARKARRRSGLPVYYLKLSEPSAGRT